MIIALLMCLLNTVAATAKDFVLRSPDGKINVAISCGKNLSYAVSYGGKAYVLPSFVSMTLADGRVLGENLKLVKSSVSGVDRMINPPYGIAANLKDNYNELVLEFSGNYRVAFRAYNECFAYRFITGFTGEIKVTAEKAEFRLASEDEAYFHTVMSEAEYRVQKVSQVLAPNYSSMPLLVRSAAGMNILIHESDVSGYPCMSLKVAGRDNLLLGEHAAYPKKVVPGGHMNFNLKVTETENYIAKTSGTRSFPWRLVVFAPKDADILSNQSVYLLGKESVIGDASWIRPGKVAWDWWNALNLSGVDFKTGFNTETYKYFIDFAAKNNIEYVNLDEGWSDQFDLMKITDKLDMPEVIRYAKEKKVGLILWCVWYTLDRQMIAAMDQFEKWGISGIKVDFMDRDDQVVVEFQERLLREAAKRKMLVNYHGAYHPNGMERTYPNYINTEGVKGLEWNKFDTAGVGPDHDVTIPFIRMFAGAMDYTPGAMSNFNKTDWKQIFDRPMSQGTRCHQLAMYTVYYAPLQMLADAPTAYEKEPEFLKYLSGIPTVWDKTVALDSKVGEYVCIARRKGTDWFMGAMTGWKEKSLKVKLDFLNPAKRYKVEIFMDGPNAAKVGNDYKRVLKEVKSTDEMEIVMASGGGWSARFTVID
ncbi:glycoside hydrolase family 97 protein [Pedobacter sp. UC225_61]|uniref:glycoside hydrolase family 97 protein n=1 Tax=Pedobacter sp. UC225_61 TaxID=3374623 RepID=UPI0037C83DA6